MKRRSGRQDAAEVLAYGVLSGQCGRVLMCMAAPAAPVRVEGCPGEGGELCSTLWETFVGSGIAVSQRSGGALSAGPVFRLEALGARVTSGARPAVMSGRNSLPTPNTSAQALCPYSVSRGRRAVAALGGRSMRGKNKNGGRQRSETVLFSICPDPDYPGFFCRPPAPENVISESSERRCCRLRT